MKKLATSATRSLAILLLCACLSFTLSAQGGFVVTPNIFDEQYEDVDLSDEYMSLRFEASMSNSSSETIDIRWERFILSPCPEAWDIFVSDINVSYLPWVSTNPFPVQLNPADTGQIFYIDIFPRTVAGCCEMDVVFSDYNDPENVLDTIHYTIRINDALCSTTSTQDPSLVSTEISVFPNPTTAAFSIDSTVDLDQIILFNSLGERLKSLPLQEDPIYSIRDLPNGLYLLQYYRNGRLEGASRLIKSSQ